jgi:hypothetical protein
MSRRVVVDWGFNVVPFDPQTKRRDLWGALFVGGLSAAAAASAVWLAGREGLHLQSPISQLLRDFGSVARVEPAAAGVYALAGILGAAAGVWGFFEGFKPRERGLRHIRGRRYLEGLEAIKAAQRITQKEIEEGGAGVALGALRMSAERESIHTLIVGGVGAGKTTIAHHLLRDIFQRNDKALIVDWKGDFVAGYKGHIFNPLDRRSIRWAVALDITSELDAASFAAQIIPERQGNGDAYFTTAGRSVLTALVIKLQRTQPQAWTWADLYAEASAGYDSIRQAVAAYYPHALANIEEPGKQTQGVLSQMLAQFDPIRILAQAQADNPDAPAISAAQWLQSHYKRDQIILAGSVQHEQICRAFMSAFITAVASRLQSLPDSKERRFWLVLDEFPKLGKVDAVPALVAFGRSKGARVVLLAQDVAQIRDTYGQNIAKSLPAMMGTLIIGRTQGGETADQIARQWVGVREVERRNITHQGGDKSSASWQRDEMLVVAPAELAQLGKQGKGKNARIEALVIGLEDYALRLPFGFVQPTAQRSGFELRPCFDGLKPAKMEEQTIHSNDEAQRTAPEHEAGEVPEQVAHTWADVAPIGGHLLESLSAVEQVLAAFQTPTKPAAPAHHAKRPSIEQEEEKGD